MPLQFGLNIKKAAQSTRKSIFDEPDLDDYDDSQDLPPPPGRPSGLSKSNGLKGPPNALSRAKAKDDRQDAASMTAAKKQVKAAEEIDPSIFDYDTFLEAKSTVHEAKKAAAKQEAIERKPKYIDKLLDAAARRKQDQLVAQEKLLQRERENEGDEFADKEKFVTGAYKQQQEEARRLQAEEQKKAEAEEERRRRGGGGMQSFYRTVMEQTEKDHQAAIEAAANFDKNRVDHTENAKTKTDAELAQDMKAKGLNVRVNDEGQFVDKRELLSAGLNVTSSGEGKASGGADHLRTAAQRQQTAFKKKDFAAERAAGERQRQMIEEQMEASAKRKREEDEEQRLQEERESKSKKTASDVSDAKARYLARKAARERGEG